MDLPQPRLVQPPDCACKGRAPQMREHTAAFCSRLTTTEVNEAIGMLDGVPRVFEECFPNARNFTFGSLPESRT